MAKQKNNRQYQVTWAQTVRDTLINAMNKGQLVLLGFLLIIIFIIYKIPDSEITELVKDLGSSFKSLVGVSYALNIFLAFGWYFTSKAFRKMHSTESERIGIEKQKAQQDALELREGRIK